MNKEHSLAEDDQSPSPQSSPHSWREADYGTSEVRSDSLPTRHQHAREWVASPFARERGRVRDTSCNPPRVRTRSLAKRLQAPGELDGSKTVAP